MQKNQKKTSALFFLTLFTLSMVLSFVWYDRDNTNTWKGEIWADKAGYYVYLPAAFLFQFDPGHFPENIDHKTGDGFVANPETGKVYTKYTYGVAFFLAPFFLATEAYCAIFSIPDEGGFAPVFHQMVHVAAIFYLLLALFFLRKVLSGYFSPSVQYITLLLIYVGTNLFYYTLIESLFSHVYSFFLFALFLYSIRRYHLQKRFGDFILISVTVAFITLIRPTNLLVFLLFFLWDLSAITDLKKRILLFLKPRYSLSFLGILLLIYLPQFLYWYHSQGSFLYYSYGEEGFSNWNAPFIPEVWLAPLNGLFVYSPMILLAVIGMIMMAVKKEMNGIVSLFLFLAVSYICAAWERWYFGCSLGLRPMIEYYAVFAVPLGYLIVWIWQRKVRLFRFSFIFLLVLFTTYSVLVTIAFEKCFFGSTWDWERYTHLVGRATGVEVERYPVTHRNDFENMAIVDRSQFSKVVRRSGLYSLGVNETREFSGNYLKYLRDLPSHRLPEEVRSTFWVYRDSKDSTAIQFVCTIQNDSSLLYWRSGSLDSLSFVKGAWQQVEVTFPIPDDLPSNAWIIHYFWNWNRKCIFIDDLVVQYR